MKKRSLIGILVLFLSLTITGNVWSLDVLPVNPGFESGKVAWQEYSREGFSNITEDSSIAHGGSWFAWLGGYDDAIDFIYQDVAIPSGSDKVYLKFWYWVDTEEEPGPYDTTAVQILNPSDDVVLRTLYTLSNLDQTNGEWVQSSDYDVSQFKGQTIRLRFYTKTDYSLSTSFLIDDVAIVTGNSPPSPLDDTTEFVKQQYRDFLNREADPGGLQFWVDQIDSGAMTRAQVIESFMQSQEFEGRIAPIVRLYFAYFLRVPDYGGLLYWISQYTNGTPLASISDAFASSKEFHQRYGSLTNDGFVTLAYQNVLGRSPDPEGYAYWLGQLDTGTQTRGQVMLGFSESVEFRGLINNEVFVTMTYVGILGRSPEQGGFDFWVGYLDDGNSELSLIGQFLNSEEYANRF